MWKYGDDGGKGGNQKKIKSWSWSENWHLPLAEKWFSDLAEVEQAQFFFFFKL